MGRGCERARDLDDVALRKRQARPTRLLIGMRSSAVAIRARMRVGRRGAARSGERRRGELKIFQHGQIGRQRRVLIDHRDADLAHPPRIRRLDVLAVVMDGAGVGLQHAGGDADQRRFAGAVLADDGVDLAGHDERRRRPSAPAPGRKLLRTPASVITGTCAVTGGAGCLHDVMHGAAAA